MHKTAFLLAAAAVLAAPAAFADRDDHDGHGHGHGHGHGKGHGKKEVYWDGHCKVERKWKHGEYEEKRKCHAPPPQVVVVPAPPPVQQVVIVPWMQRQQQGGYVYKPQHRPVQVAGTNQCHSQAVGSVVGGIVGGALGNQIGKGNGRTAATIGGAVAGVLVGGEVGRRMDAADQACVGQVLEVAPVGRRVQWAEGQANYVVVPGQVAYRKGSYCRPYTLEMKTDRGWERTQGTACRRPDGVWVSA
jgi:surface antigen